MIGFALFARLERARTIHEAKIIMFVLEIGEGGPIVWGVAEYLGQFGRMHN